jgi:O-methyltransferase involved in polyketide biosynthesis
MSNDAFESREIDATRPSAARMYHYYLTGEAIFDVDRVFGEHIFQVAPNTSLTAHHNREFLQRATTFLVGRGIRQFLDIGSGLPTNENTHEVAQQVAPQARIVYVDSDPIVLAHSRALLNSTPEGATAYVQADARDPGLILREAGATLDFSQPVAIMALLVLHYVPDDDQPHRIVSALLEAVPPGSYLVISDATTAIDADRATEGAARLNARLGPARSTLRSRAEIARYFDGLDLVEPGLVPMPQWRNPDDPLVAAVLAGVGRKPG